MAAVSEMGRSTVEVLPAGREPVLRNVAERFGTPAYVYMQGDLEKSLRIFQDIPAPHGLVVRYAMKANPTGAILRLYDRMGAHFDASTFNETYRAIEGARVNGSKIRLTSQEVQSVENLDYLRENGVLYTASSLRQLDTYGQHSPGADVGVRFNVGIGSGWTGQVSTGGEGSSFGIYQQRDQIDELLAKHDLNLTTVHLHIGSGSDPNKQKDAIREGLDLIKDYPSVTTLNMGGGFKVARMSEEHGTDIAEMGRAMSIALREFKEETGREIVLEVEPGTALVANPGYIVTEVVDLKNTGAQGMKFLVSSGGMNMNARPALYGAQHPLYVIPMDGTQRGVEEYVVVGINCESGDILTPMPGDPEQIKPRLLLEAHMGDLLVTGGAGAYTAGMALGNYNSQQLHREVLVRTDGSLDLIRETQPLKDIWSREKIPSDL